LQRFDGIHFDLPLFPFSILGQEGYQIQAIFGGSCARNSISLQPMRLHESWSRRTRKILGGQQEISD
ncbi:MAG: hypothetical protein L0Z53_16530, partial [Acidobacteriales bacterium]|nr:hypothetical protein [Terriglobales bacterium]